MRKTIIPAMLVMLLLTGCASERVSKQPKKLAKDLDKKVEITMCGREYEAMLRRGGKGAWECEFTAPECIAGLKLTTTDESCMIEMSGLSYETELPESSMMTQLTGALEALTDGSDLSCTEKGNVLTEVGDGFTAVIKKGELTSLKTELLEARFSAPSKDIDRV